ncbi:unnamed protein product [Ceutorhynchus assimilis]|uniref:DRBM domain-containing protein n=1 Tax=Ceutorhynchus assimilis TaxID=467358 RepID=A0A9N9QD36_9CUCU|nr:unnamed protein product [Ceutorhynchus assimilis]
MSSGYDKFFKTGDCLLLELISNDIFEGIYVGGGKDRITICETVQYNRKLGGIYEFYRNEISKVYYLKELDLSKEEIEKEESQLEANYRFVRPRKMAQNAKTPVMVLQELAMHKGFGTPDYEIIFAAAGSHQNRFDYRVTVAGIQASGSGSSKQISKHQAAHNALMRLKELGIYVPAENPVASFKVPLRDEGSPFEPALNCIVELGYITTENKLPCAEFVEISSVGPPHKREFTFDCKMASLTTTATASTKKMAKQIAAKEMIEKLKELLPQLVEQQQSGDVEMKNQITEAITKYQEFVESPIPDRSINLEEMDHSLAKLMYLKRLTYKDFEEDLKIPTEESLIKILDRLEVKHSFKVIQEEPIIIISLSLKIDTPFTIWDTGDNLEEAKQKALVQSFEIMDGMMKIKI